MYDREVRSGNSRRKARNKGGTTTRRPSLALLGPLLVNMNFRASRAGFPPPLTLSCCGTYLQGGNGVDVQGDSTGVYPAHCRDQRPRVTRGKWHGHTPPGLLHAELGARLRKMVAQHSGALMLRLRWRS